MRGIPRSIRVCIPNKRKRNAVKRIKENYKISKKVIIIIIIKKSHLVPKVVIDLLFEGRSKEARNTEEGRVPKAGSRREGPITELINSCILALESSTQ